MSLRLAALVFFLVLSAGASFFSIQEARPVALSVMQAHEPLAGGAAWGMTPAEIEGTRGKPLSVLGDSARYYAPSVEQPDRYRSYEQRDVQVLRRPARVVYTFFDNRFFALHVFLSDSDPERLDQSVRQYLVRRFGGRSNTINDGSSLKMVWQFSDRMVNYWFMEEEIALRAKFTGVIGVTRRFLSGPDGTRVEL